MKITIEGVRLELDMLDAEENERAAGAFGKLAAEMRLLRDAPPNGAAEGIRRQCQAIFVCFDDIFGQGTAERVFGGRCHLQRAVRAFEKLSRAAAKQQEAFAAEAALALERYAPERVTWDEPAD